MGAHLSLVLGQDRPGSVYLARSVGTIALALAVLVVLSGFMQWRPRDDRAYRMRYRVPRAIGDRCTCQGCWACTGHEFGCTCDIDWDALMQEERER